MRVPRVSVVPLALLVGASCADPGISPRSLPSSTVSSATAASPATGLRDIVARRYARLGADSTQAVLRVDTLSFSGGAQACATAGRLVGRTLDLYFAGQLEVAPKQPTLQADVQYIVAQATRIAAAAPQSTCPNGYTLLPDSAFAPSGAARFLVAAVGGTVATADSTAQLFVPAAALPFDAVVYIARRTGNAAVLPTALPQDGPQVDIGSSPALATAPNQRLNAPASLLLNSPTGLVGTSHSVIGHVTLAGLVLLAPGGSLACPNAPYEQFSRTVGTVAPAVGAASVVPNAVRRPPCSSGTVLDLSPFGRIQIFDSTATPRAAVRVTHVCGTRFVAHSTSAREWVIWSRLVTRTGTALPGARGTYTRLPAAPAGGASDTPFDAEAPGGLGTTRALQVYYGPILLRAVALTGPLACAS
ncbi:MAG TPA: hypothetical protein VGD56_17755 [Gemmatirosa sp.]